MTRSDSEPESKVEEQPHPELEDKLIAVLGPSKTDGNTPLRRSLKHRLSSQRKNSLEPAPNIRRRSSADRVHRIPLKISFKNINYTKHIPAESGKPAHKQVILNNCSGYLEPG